jgi:hypothetical protein
MPEIAVAPEWRAQNLAKARAARRKLNHGRIGDAEIIAGRKLRRVAVVAIGKEELQHRRGEPFGDQPVDHEGRRIERRMKGERNPAWGEQVRHFRPGPRGVAHVLHHHAQDDEVVAPVLFWIDIASDVEKGAAEFPRAPA